MLPVNQVAKIIKKICAIAKDAVSPNAMLLRMIFSGFKAITLKITKLVRAILNNRNTEPTILKVKIFLVRIFMLLFYSL